MQRNLCPHCGQYGVSAIRKLWLGPLFPARCSECGNRVGVPLISALANLPVLAGLFLVLLFDHGSLLSFWLGALGTLGMLHLWYGYVPLIKR